MLSGYDVIPRFIVFLLLAINSLSTSLLFHSGSRENQRKQRSMERERDEFITMELVR